MDEFKGNSNPVEEYKIIVADSLKVIARFTGSRRALLSFFNHDWHRMSTVFRWPEDDDGITDPNVGKLKPDLWMQSGWWVKQLRQNNFLRYYSLFDLPNEVEPDLVRLREEAVQAFCLLAVYDGKRLAGILRLDNPPAERNLVGVDIDLLQIASTLILQVVRASMDFSGLRLDPTRPANTLWQGDLSETSSRRKFLENVQDAFRHKGRLFSILLVEIDCFSLLQHRYGVEVSQRLLQTAIDRIQAGLRASDIVTCLEDDLVGILLVDLFEHSYTDTVAKRILNVFNTPYRINGKDIGLTACIGASFPEPDDVLAEVVLQEAEIALTQARRSTKERYLAFDAAMRSRLLERIDLENDLRGSLKKDHLLLHYQPITALESGQLVGFEALVRWQHPTRGLIWPIEFIHLSEDTGLIIPLGEWVLHEACRQMRIWQDTFRTVPPLMVSVNISVVQLEQEEFPNMLARILAETGLPANTLRLEITESVVVQDNCQMLARLDKLRAMGVQLYIDDFGKGYSSLSYLDTLPADAIKIDRSFVSNLGQPRSNGGVVQAIIQMARDLKIDVVAEGVETLEQQSELRRMHCGFVQGYFVSEPLETKEAARYIGRRELNRAGRIII